MPPFSRLKSLSGFCELAAVMVAVFMCFFGHIGWGQTNTYTNYQFEQGFKASNAYCLFQDRKGYIWIGTENGLMRFNGHEFKVYTTHDGLPDNEILNISEDRAGRLWLIPYANTICYIKNGKVFNRDNDSLLRLFRLDSRPEAMRIGRDGTIWVKNGGKLTGITPEGKRIEFAGKAGKIYSCWLDKGEELMAMDASGNIFQWDITHFISKGKTPWAPGYATWANDSVWVDINRNVLSRHGKSTGIEQFSNTVTLEPIHNAIHVSQFSPAAVHITSDEGVREIDINTGRVRDSFLTNCKVGAIMQAKDHSLWIGTIGQGLFRISKTPIKSINFPGKPPSVLYIKGNHQHIYGTTGDARLFEVDVKDKELAKHVRFTSLDKYNPFNRYVFILPYGSKKWLAFSSYVGLKPKEIKSWTYEMGIVCKAVIREEANRMLIGSAIGLLRYDINTLRAVDTFLPGKKTMAIAKINDTIYAGTIDGLIAITNNKRSHPFLPAFPALRRHITALCTDKNNMLWCANNKSELIGLKHDSLLAFIDIRKGLQCSRISCLQATDDFVWIGTDNGLYAIKQQPPYNVVRHITFASGLSSNQVNALDICDNRIWVATLKGVNYFEEDDIFLEKDSSKIVINRILNGDSLLSFSKNSIVLQNKPLTIDFDIVDFSGGTKAIFEYRIDNGPWTLLEGKSLYFSTLPSGEFTLSLRAFSANWTGDITFQQIFYNSLPYYRTWWFIAGICIFIISLFLIGISAFIRRVRKRDRKQLGIQKNLLLLEQTALQGQMNPHFIFNCIAAMKQYYNSGDITKANNFVHSFATLIRQTFEMGTETFLSLDKELNYLIQYLSVEQERFNNSFGYHIDKQTQLPDSSIYVPTLLLQPIVENAIRHGVRHLSKKRGMISISILQQGEIIEFIITDNGIGRQKSMRLRERNLRINMTSSTINEKRIQILGRLFDGKIRMHTTDLTDDKGNARGTEVSISFPVNLNQFLKNENNYS